MEIQGNESVAVCEYCGMKQTLPRLEDERRANLYDRANHFRQNDEFDKAMNIYDQILNEDPEDAEAYWSLVLCRYGIEYVEDPGTHKRIPTVNRAQFTSVLANDLYHELTEEGYKVFFSRITLEDKIGSAYEPYIFAALNSAKVMVVIGTRPEYFNSPWVKNEWSRYLALIKNGAKKMLIPAYKDMDPYDMPEEFSHLQAQDMGKLGFMQDLVRGIKKIAAAEEPKAADESASTGNTNTAPLLKRAFMFLEDGEWASATEYCERVLDQDPENAKAYLGKLMAELRVNLQDNLADCSEPFDERNNYKKALRFADDELTASLKGYISQINDRNELERIKRDYDRALEIMKYARNELEFKNAAELFHSTAGYENSSTWEADCLEKAEQCRKEEIYSAANKIVWKTDAEIDKLEEAIRLFESISDWNDSAERIEHCRRKIEEIKLQEERERSERERREEKERIAAKRRKIMFKIAVCDDEKYFQNRIKEILTEYQKEKNMQYKIETFDSGKELLDCETGIRQYKIVFLDMDMDDLNGILTARKIRELNEDVFIVFVTAYTKYFFKGHKMDAVRYILKDNETMTFYIYECMDAVYKKMEDKSIWKEFKFTIGYRKISLDHILYIESRLHKLEFHMLENIPLVYTLYGT